MTLYTKRLPLIVSFVFGLLTLAGCTGVPKNVEPVTPFDLDRYLGTWYEIARLDHAFERGLSEVSATYSMRDDGGVRVINQGFNEQGEIKLAEGRAYFIGDTDVGSLKVSFFGPFFGGYHIAKLDENYQMSLVIGPNTGYAWILARTPNPSVIDCQAFSNQAQAIGVDTEAWIWVQTCKE